MRAFTSTSRSAVKGWALFSGLLLAAILVPFALLGEGLEESTRGLLDQPLPTWQWSLLLGGLLASDILLPVPSSLVATATGAALGFWGGLGVSWAGMMVGCGLGYGLGARAGVAVLRRLVGEAELARVARASERLGPWFLLLFRGVPVLAEASVVFAGVSRMPLSRFLALCALSNLCVSASYAAVGATAMRTGTFVWLFVGMGLVPALALWLVRGLKA